MMTDGAGGASQTGDGAPKSRRRIVKDFVSGKAVELIAGGVTFATVAALTAGWKLSEPYVGRYIIDVLERDPKAVRRLVVGAAIEELDANEGKLQDAVRGFLARVRKTEAGMVTAGRFSLTPNENYVLYVYFPEGSAGKISYQIEGDIVGDRRFVVLQSPNGMQNRIRNLHGTIDIPTHLQVASDQKGPQLVVAEEMSPFLRNLRGFTFQLVDRLAEYGTFQTSDKHPLGATNAQAEHLKIDVSYVAYVTPAIHIK